MNYNSIYSVYFKKLHPGRILHDQPYYIYAYLPLIISSIIAFFIVLISLSVYKTKDIFSTFYPLLFIAIVLILIFAHIFFYLNPKNKKRILELLPEIDKNSFSRTDLWNEYGYYQNLKDDLFFDEYLKNYHFDKKNIKKSKKERKKLLSIIKNDIKYSYKLSKKYKYSPIIEYALILGILVPVWDNYISSILNCLGTTISDINTIGGLFFILSIVIICAYWFLKTIFIEKMNTKSNNYITLINTLNELEKKIKYTK